MISLPQAARFLLLFAGGGCPRGKAGGAACQAAPGTAGAGTSVNELPGARCRRAAIGPIGGSGARDVRATSKSSACWLGCGTVPEQALNWFGWRGTGVDLRSAPASDVPLAARRVPERAGAVRWLLVHQRNNAHACAGLAWLWQPEVKSAPSIRTPHPCA
eukprot:353375-Chlamydomonas_euryale.AAC.4